ncbi:MAG: HAD family phosphatase [Acidobacteriota bacterium]|nr:HAD family phosphatase [Acidobacteriota bacterium]
MPNIKTIFWDIGGVLLNNAWDHTEREQAVQRFHLNPAEFDEKHQRVVSSFEKGELSLDEYLDQTVFYQPRDFRKAAFKKFMFSLSQPNSDALNVARKIASSGKYFMGTINNESTELNQYRIRTFNLREIFSVFISSCFVGMLKPDKHIYRMALLLRQESPEECLFIDDRPANLEPAAGLGMKVIQMKDAEQLQRELKRMQVTS